MNGSSQLEEADQKPFALCPVCLRKMSSYLGFNGHELQLFKELRDVFKLMNHNDTQQSFRRELKLFDRVIARLSELYEQQGLSGRSHQQDAEGGNFELQRLDQENKKQYEIGLI